MKFYRPASFSLGALAFLGNDSILVRAGSCWPSRDANENCVCNGSTFCIAPGPLPANSPADCLQVAGVTGLPWDLPFYQDDSGVCTPVPGAQPIGQCCTGRDGNGHCTGCFTSLSNPSQCAAGTTSFNDYLLEGNFENCISVIGSDYYSVAWADLPPQIQEAYAFLGYDAALWDRDGHSPLYWSDLTPEQQGVATFIGYTQETWDHIPGKMYYHLSWADLPTEIQEAYVTLGYTQAIWDSGNSPSLSWSDLTPEQQQVAASIGYTQQLWDWPESAGVEGDPHFKTWSGHKFDFHGACDLVLLHSQDFFHGLGLDVHIRTTKRYQYSFISSVAIQIGEDTLEISSWGQHSLNGVSGALEFSPADGHVMGQLATVVYELVNKKNHKFEISLDKTTTIRIKTFKDIVSVSIDAKSLDSFQGSIGLLGSPSKTKGQMLARDGKTVLEDPNAFGQEWQVRDTEPKLFENVDLFPQFPAGCVMPDPTATSAQEARRRLGEDLILEEVAAAACTAAGRHKDMENCIYDVMAMGDLEVAEAGAF